MVKQRRNFILPEPECNRTGTGNKFNLIMRMTVRKYTLRTVYLFITLGKPTDNSVASILSECNMHAHACDNNAVHVLSMAT